MQLFRSIIVCAGLTLSSTMFALCITDSGPYQDDYGFALFPFYNNCDQAVLVTLCVKSLPPESDKAVFNYYSGTASGFSTLTLTDGKWNAFQSYRWNEDASVDCPFND